VIRFTIFILLLVCPFTLCRAEVLSGGAPQIKCEISMATWCIASFDGAISLEDEGNFRVWRLSARGQPVETPMIIRENKGCSDSAEESIALISVGTNVRVSGANYESTSYRLNGNGCVIEFSIPVGAAGDVYRQVMLYAILVGNDRSTQLYRFH